MIFLIFEHMGGILTGSTDGVFNYDNETVYEVKIGNFVFSVPEKRVIDLSSDEQKLIKKYPEYYI